MYYLIFEDSDLDEVEPYRTLEGAKVEGYAQMGHYSWFTIMDDRFVPVFHGTEYDHERLFREGEGE